MDSSSVLQQSAKDGQLLLDTLSSLGEYLIKSNNAQKRDTLHGTDSKQVIPDISNSTTEATNLILSLKNSHIKPLNNSQDDNTGNPSTRRGQKRTRGRNARRARRVSGLENWEENQSSADSTTSRKSRQSSRKRIRSSQYDEDVHPHDAREDARDHRSFNHHVHSHKSVYRDSLGLRSELESVDGSRVAHPNQVIISRLLYEKLVSRLHASTEDEPYVDTLYCADSLMPSKSSSETRTSAVRAAAGQKTTANNRHVVPRPKYSNMNVIGIPSVFPTQLRTPCTLEGAVFVPFSEQSFPTVTQLNKPPVVVKSRNVGYTYLSCLY